MPPQDSNGFETAVGLSHDTRGSQSMTDARLPTPIDQIGVARSSRQQHDSVLSSSSPRIPYPQSPSSPLKSEMPQDYRTTEFFLEDPAAEEAWALGGRTPTTMKSGIPPRKESLQFLQAATSPLARATPMEEDISSGSLSPPLRASNNSSPNLRNEQWWRPDSRPASGQPSPGLPSPTAARAMELRSSSSSINLATQAQAAPGSARLRGMTASSAQSPTLHHSTSIPDLATLRHSNRTLPTSVYRPSRGPAGMRDSAQSSLRREPFAAPFAEENRASVRSAWTAASSGFLGSERSSVTSRASSSSDLARMTRNVDELILSVEDAINMYTNGFTDDFPEELKANIPKDDRFIPRQTDSTLQPRDSSSSRMQSITIYEDQSRPEERTPIAARSPIGQAVQAPPRSPMDQRTPVPPRSPLQHQSYPPEVAESISGRTMVETPRTTFDPKFSNIPGSPFELKFTLPPDSPTSQPPSTISLDSPRLQSDGRSTQQSDDPPPFSSSPLSPKSPSQPPTPLPKDEVYLSGQMERLPSNPVDERYSQPPLAKANPIPAGDVGSPPPIQKMEATPDIFQPATFEQAPSKPLQALKRYPTLPSSPDMHRRKESNTSRTSNTSHTSRNSETEFTNPRSPPQLPPNNIERDRYGFKKATQYINIEQYDEWNVGYSEYLNRRRVKWEALMKQYGLPIDNPVRFPPKTEKVKRYIRKGIPPEWRGAAWFWYAGGPGRLIQNSGLYQKLMRDINIGRLSESDREHIERDLNRTFPDNAKFKPDMPRRKRSNGEVEEPEDLPDTPIIHSLRRVLQAFAIHNPGIGYCQSLNFLAGMLLIFLDEDEERTFIMLNIITTLHLPGTHAKVLEANVDIGVLMMCIKETMPAIWAKIDDSNDDLVKPSNNPSGSLSRLPTVSLATTAWFMSCFIGNLPVESVLRVWDAFWYEGSKTLFRIALTVFKIADSDIRSATEHMEIFQLVQTIPRRLLDANGLMEACYKRRGGFGNISQEVIDTRRVERRKVLADERARKMGAKSATQANGVVDLEEDTSSRGRLRRVASRARIKRAQSKKRIAKASQT